MELPRPVKILLLIYGLFFFVLGLVVSIKKITKFIKKKLFKKKSVYEISIKEYQEVLNKHTEENTLYWNPEEESPFKGEVKSTDLQKYVFMVRKAFPFLFQLIEVNAESIVSMSIDDGIFVSKNMITEVKDETESESTGKTEEVQVESESEQTGETLHDVLWTT